MKVTQLDKKMLTKDAETPSKDSMKHLLLALLPKHCVLSSEFSETRHGNSLLSVYETVLMSLSHQPATFRFLKCHHVVEHNLLNKTVYATCLSRSSQPFSSSDTLC